MNLCCNISCDVSFRVAAKVGTVERGRLKQSFEIFADAGVISCHMVLSLKATPTTFTVVSNRHTKD
ncbi:hypothetical protein V1504DRAFT_448183 [Lipomyces starkeyi]